jgi:uncharacterized protein (DUF169 family)
MQQSSVFIDSEVLLDDRKFAEAMLLKKDKAGLSRADMVFVLRNLLRLKYYPVAVKFFYDEAEVEKFKAEHEYLVACNPFTFCHFCAESRQKGDVLFGEKRTLPEGLLAFATAPVHKAKFEPDLVFIICDVLQSYHLYNDYAAAMDVHPIRPNFMMNSAACGGAVWSYVENTINIVPMCSGSYTAGKTEQGEINVFIPWAHFEKLVVRLLERTASQGGASFPRTGETYPGFDICKLCNFLLFKKPKEDE